MAKFNLDRFKSQIASEGLARENRFEVEIPGSDISSLLCESSHLPVITMLARKQQLQGPPYTTVTGADYGGASIQMTFYVDRSMQVKKFFDSWMNSIIIPGSFEANFQKNYVKPIKISQLDENEDITYKVTLIDAFPIAMGMLNLSASSTNTVHRLPMSFAYRYWMVEGPVDEKPTVPEASLPSQPSTAPTYNDPSKDIAERARGFKGGGGQFGGAGNSGGFED